MSCGLRGTQAVEQNGESGRTCDVLLLGCEGVGKTTLVRTMKDLCRREKVLEKTYETVPTIGVELDELVYNKTKFTIREVGGSFIPVWSRYFSDCSMIVFMIDVSNPVQTSPSVIEFLKLFEAELLAKKPILLLFNKLDAQVVTPRPILRHLLRLDDVLHSSINPLSVHEIHRADPYTYEEVLEWITKNKRTGGGTRRTSF